MKETGLVLAEGTTNLPSYHGNNGSSSKIDYAFAHVQSFLKQGLKPSCLSIFLHECLEETPENHSTHYLWGFEINLPSDAIQSPDPKQDKPKPSQPNWKKIDEDAYQLYLHSLLQQQFEMLDSPENIPTLAEIIPTAFTSAAEAAGGSSKPKQKKPFKVNKSNDLWKAEMNAKQKYKYWIKENKPRDPENENFIAKNEA